MELATRLALGAAPGHIFQMMLRTALRLAIVGLALGVSAAYGGGRLLSGYIYAMRAADPWVIVTAGAMVAAVTVAATMIPALRASRLEPRSRAAAGMTRSVRCAWRGVRSPSPKP